MGAVLIHPLTIAIIGGLIAIGIAAYNNFSTRNLFYAKMRVEAQAKADTMLSEKVDQADCDSQVEKCAARFEKGEENFKKIERALVAIYVKQGGTPQELSL